MALAFDKREFLAYEPRDIAKDVGPTDVEWSYGLLNNPEGIRILSSIVMKAVSEEAEVNPNNKRVWDEINTRSRRLACTDDEWELIRTGMLRNSR